MLRFGNSLALVFVLAVLGTSGCDTAVTQHTDGGCTSIDPATGHCRCGITADCAEANHPICDVGTHACIACGSDADCSARPGTPVCDTQSGACVACSSDADCSSHPDAKACDTATGACVTCTTSAHCTAAGAAPHCDASTHACAPCASNADCASTPTTPICDVATGACGACTADAECAGIAATPVCDEGSGKCVECTVDTEVARCGLTSCSRTEFTCTMTKRASVAACGSCQADSECVTSAACVPMLGPAPASTMLGTYCLPRLPVSGMCADTGANAALLPYWMSLTKTTVDGASAAVCSPRASVSCDAIRAQGTFCTIVSTPAGEASLGCGSATLEDGVCFTPGGSTSAKCSYKCSDASDCGEGQVCAVAGTAKFCQ